MYYIRKMTPIAAGIVALVVVGAVGFFTVDQIRTESEKIVDNTLPAVTCAGQINAYQAENFNRALLVITADNPGDRAAYRREVDDTDQIVDENMAQYQRLIQTDDGLRIFNTLILDRSEYNRSRQAAFALAESGRRDEALSLLKTSLWPAYEKYTKTGDVLFDYSIQQGDLRGRGILSVCNTTRILVAMIGISVFIVGFLTPFLVIRFGSAAEEVR